jgi:6,7-dimethyl-8-ribityllumazine synthase
MARVFPQNVSAKGLRIGIVHSRFNEEITGKLLNGAIEALVQAGADEKHLVVASVPGAWEIPFALRELARRKEFEALVAVGAVIRGETAHFDYVASGFNDGALAVMTEFSIPVGNGVLTTEDEAQALARSGGEHGNKGAEAALAAVEMAQLKAAIAAAVGT